VTSSIGAGRLATSVLGNVAENVKALRGFGDIASLGTDDVVRAEKPQTVAIMGVNAGEKQFGEKILAPQLRELGHDVHLVDLGAVSAVDGGTLLRNGAPSLQPDLVIGTKLAIERGEDVVAGLRDADVPVINGVRELRVNTDLAKRLPGLSEEVKLADDGTPLLPRDEMPMHPAVRGEDGFAKLGSSVRDDGVVTPGVLAPGKKTIGLLGTNRNVKFGRVRLADELEARGHHTVTMSVKDITTKDGKLFHKGKELPKLDLLIPRGGASMDEAGIARLKEIEAEGVPLLTSTEAIEKYGSKVETARIRQQLGTPDAGTKIIEPSVDEADNIARIAAENADGSVLKIENGTHGNGVVFLPEHPDPQVRALNIQSTVDALRVSDPNAAFVVEKWQKGAGAVGRDHRIHVMGFSDDPMKGAMTRIAAEGEARANTHKGGTAQALTPPQEIIDKSVEMARHTPGGHLAFDWMQSGDDWIHLETNTSGGVEGIERFTGENVAKNLVEGIEEGFEKGVFQPGGLKMPPVKAGAEAAKATETSTSTAAAAATDTPPAQVGGTAVPMIAGAATGAGLLGLGMLWADGKQQPTPAPTFQDAPVAAPVPPMAPAGAWPVPA